MAPIRNCRYYATIRPHVELDRLVRQNFDDIFKTSNFFVTVSVNMPFLHPFFSTSGTWHSWLRHCATSGKDACSIPDGVIGIFPWHNPSGSGVDSSSNRSDYQEYFLGGKDGRCVGLTTLPPSCADCLEIWEPQPPGTLRACPDL